MTKGKVLGRCTGARSNVQVIVAPALLAALSFLFFLAHWLDFLAQGLEDASHKSGCDSGGLKRLEWVCFTRVYEQNVDPYPGA